jgi:hypothetical protein
MDPRLRQTRPVSLEQLRLEPTRGSLPAAPWPTSCWPRLIERRIPTRLGLCSSAWLDEHGPDLITLDERATPSHRSVVHGDVRSDNLCPLPDGQVRFVDWSDSGIGHPLQDLITLLPTLHLEGSDAPASRLRDPVEIIVRFAGPTILRAASRHPRPSWLRAVLRRLADIQMTWIADITDVPLDSTTPPRG